jgi:hypothetical protein
MIYPELQVFAEGRSIPKKPSTQSSPFQAVAISLPRRKVSLVGECLPSHALSQVIFAFAEEVDEEGMNNQMHRPLFAPASQAASVSIFVTLSI